MPSLAKIFGFAAVAFAAFASATPSSESYAEALVNAHKRDVVVDRAPCDACVAPGVPTLPEILVKLHVDVKAEVDLLTGITKETCKPEVVKPIVVRLCAKIEDATAKVLLLSKYKLDEILFDGKVVVSVKVLANLICSLLITVFTALGVVLRFIGTIKCDVGELLCQVGIALARLLHCILGVVAHLLDELIVILCIELKAVFWVIVKLSLLDICALLKIDVKLYA